MVIIVGVVIAMESCAVAHAQKLKAPSGTSKATSSSNLSSADSTKSSEAKSKDAVGSLSKQESRGEPSVAQGAHQKGQQSAQLLPADTSPILPNVQLKITPLNIAPTGISGASSGRSGNTSHSGKQAGSKGSKDSGGEKSANHSASH